MMIYYILYFAGAALASSAIHSAFGATPLFLVAAAATALHWLSLESRPAPIRATAHLLQAGLVVSWIYLAAMFGWMLAWTLPWTAWFVLLGSAAMAASSRRVPFVLPLGLWISLCLLGWWREDGVVRCDDYRRVVDSAEVAVMIPSTAAMRDCHAGQVWRLERYPRRIWEDPDGSRFLVPTQLGINRPPQGEPVPDPITGGLCEFAADGSRRTCLGDPAFKMQVIFDSPSLDRVFFGGWGRGRGIVYGVPRSGAFAIASEARTDGSTGEGYYDPASGEIGLFADECTGLTRLQAADLTPLPHQPAPYCPGEAHYDVERREGILCFAPGPLAPFLPGDEGGGYLSVGFHGSPFTPRRLGLADGHPWVYASMVWGCEFDPQTRQAWAAIANLPLLAEIDFDSGVITRVWPSEPGLRSAAFDPKRHLLFVTNFLRGDVIAIDVESGREVRRWFGGRFVRYVAISRDGQSLLVTSTLGVLRIPLDRVLDRS